jgi:hypothetical protein
MMKEGSQRPSWASFDTNSVRDSIVSNKTESNPSSVLTRLFAFFKLSTSSGQESPNGSKKSLISDSDSSGTTTDSETKSSCCTCWPFSRK